MLLLLQRPLQYPPNAEMTLDLEANEVEVKVLTSLASVAESTGISSADFMFVFANFPFAEDGMHEELRKMKGIYSEMCLAQSLDQA